MPEIAEIDHAPLDGKFNLTHEYRMSTTEVGSTIFQAIAHRFASNPSDEQILGFRPSREIAQRASQLLEMNRCGQIDEETKHELEH